MTEIACRIVEVDSKVSSFPDFSGLPSPATSLPELSSDSETLADSSSLESTIALTVTSSPPLSKKRKRSTSIVETSLSPKSTCPAPQRLHIVSNSLPSVYPLPHEDQSPNDLFNPGLPPAITTVDLASLDPSLELDIFEWNASLSEQTAAAMRQICELALFYGVCAELLLQCLPPLKQMLCHSSELWWIAIFPSRPGTFRVSLCL
jgi:hypothetical protein